MGRILNASIILPACIILIVLLYPTTAVSRRSAAAERKLGTYVHSGRKLRELAQKDFALAERLKAFIEKDHATAPPSKVLKMANKYLDDFANSTTSEFRSNATAHGEQCVKNPLLRFKLIRRVAHLLRILRSRKSGDVQGIKRLTKGAFQNVGPVIFSDLNEAMDAILQIHFTYNLKATDLAAGKLEARGTEASLLASHCLQIGLWAKRSRQYALAVEWLKEAIRLAKTDGTIDLATVRAELLSAIRDHNLRWDNAGLYNMFLYARPLKSNLVNDDDDGHQDLKARELLEVKYAGRGRNGSYWDVNTWRLCSGPNNHTPYASSHLFCWLEFKAHKALTVGPVKMELLSRSPDVVQIYDAFDSQKLSANMANGNVSLANLEAVMASSFSNGAGTVAEGSPQFKASEYLAGAPSEIQVDAQPQEGSTNRPDATLLLNLNNVDTGGYTVLPAALATSVPIQGSAIFWFNTLSDGSADLSTAYTHCPVILGQKTVAHKWLSFSNRKCLLQPKDRFQVLVNGEVIATPPALQHQLMTQEDYGNPEPLIALDVAVEKDYYRNKILKYAYGSVQSIRSLIQLDWEIHTSIKQTAAGKTALDQSWELIQPYLQDFNEAVYNSILLMANATERNKAVSKLAWNPLAIYRTMWRFENYVKKWTSHKERLPPAVEYIERLYNVTDGPTHRDLEYSIVGILIMQETYDFKSQDIAEGILDEMDMGIKLSTAQCIEFGRVAVMHGFFHIGVEWMETAVGKMVTEGRTAAKLVAVQEELETAKKAHDMSLQRTKGKDPNTYTQPVGSVNRSSTNLRTNKDVLYNTYKFSIGPNHTVINYFGVCQGKEHQTVQEQSVLFCWYETEVDPYWKIRPLKAELLSMHPKAEVILFHDILTKQLIRYLLNDTDDAQQDIFLSKTTDEVNPVDRLGTILWRDTNSSQESLTITKIVEKASGLRIAVGDIRSRLQIATYPPGSHYKVHPDTVSFGKDDDVARIATFMFYLNDVEKGGATAFSQAGVRVPPKTGSAILWYNMLSTGVMDRYTSHGACPVIYGEKHVATQWLRYIHQDHLTCHRDRKKRIEFLVNGKSKYGS